MSVYLDYNASTPIDPRVLDVMISVYQNNYGNADSRTHDYGENARKIVVESRNKVASLLGVNSDEVIFTSGSTESNNIAIQGLREYAEKTGKKHIITTPFEHHSVLNVCRALQKEGFSVDYVNVDFTGRINPQEVMDLVREDTLLVSIMHVNNETGIIQPVEQLGNLLQKKNVLFHIDATQSVGKLVDELRNTAYDMLSFSAHKLEGPQGIGALILRKKKYKYPPIKPVYYGGQQEHGIRPGTTPVALCAGMGKACEIAENEYKERAEKNKKIKNSILQLLKNTNVKYHINGEQKYCIDNTINIRFEGVSSEALMIAGRQFCSISNGSACDSKSYSPSYVLKAMGLDDDQCFSSVRVSWGPFTECREIEINFKKFLSVAESLQL